MRVRPFLAGDKYRIEIGLRSYTPEAARCLARAILEAADDADRQATQDDRRKA